MNYAQIKTRQDYEALARYVITVTNCIKHDPVLLKIQKDGLRNQIFDMKCIELGLVSEAAIASGKKKAELTKEHIYPRNKSAIRIINAVLDGATYDEVRELIIQACQVVITTKEENLRLIPLQASDDYFWRTGYEQVGIKLAEYEFPTVQKYIYKVDEIVYNSCQEAADANGCSRYAAQHRFASKARKSKFKGWARHNS